MLYILLYKCWSFISVIGTDKTHVSNRQEKYPVFMINYLKVGVSGKKGHPQTLKGKLFRDFSIPFYDYST